MLEEKPATMILSLEFLTISLIVCETSASDLDQFGFNEIVESDSITSTPSLPH
jgi:hypothetical protein